MSLFGDDDDDDNDLLTTKAAITDNQPNKYLNALCVPVTTGHKSSSASPATWLIGKLEYCRVAITAGSEATWIPTDGDYTWSTRIEDVPICFDIPCESSLLSVSWSTVLPMVLPSVLAALVMEYVMYTRETFPRASSRDIVTITSAVASSVASRRNARRNVPAPKCDQYMCCYGRMVTNDALTITQWQRVSNREIRNPNVHYRTAPGYITSYSPLPAAHQMMTYFRVECCWPVTPPSVSLVVPDDIEVMSRMDKERGNNIKRPSWDTSTNGWWTFGQSAWPYAIVAIDTSSWPIRWPRLVFRITTESPFFEVDVDEDDFPAPRLPHTISRAPWFTVTVPQDQMVHVRCRECRLEPLPRVRAWMIATTATTPLVSSSSSSSSNISDNGVIDGSIADEGAPRRGWILMSLIHGDACMSFSHTHARSSIPPLPSSTAALTKSSMTSFGH